MKKIFKIIFYIIALIYLFMYFAKVEIPRPIFIIFMDIILLNLAIKEWNKFCKAKNKINLIIPIATIFLIILSIIIPLTRLV